MEENPEAARSLVHDIVEKAGGVFLWVRLVVQSLLSGIRNMDEMSDLWERLRPMPREPEPLYHRLLDLIEPIYLPWALKPFQIVQLNQTLASRPFGKNLGEVSGVAHLTLSALL